MRRALAAFLILLTLALPAQAARTFADGAWLEFGDEIISTTPLTICAWIRPSSVTVAQHFVGIGTSATDNNRFNLAITTSGQVQAITRVTANHFTTLTTPTLSVNVWALACGVWRSATSRTVFLNSAANQTTTTDSHAPAPSSRTWIGRGVGASNSLELNGELAMAMFWNTDLADAEITALGAGAHPRMIRPANLISCPHVYGDQSPEPDECAARVYTLTGTPAKAATRPPVGLFLFGR